MILKDKKNIGYFPELFFSKMKKGRGKHFQPRGSKQVIWVEPNLWKYVTAHSTSF